MRIVIFGNSGSGKSTLAQRLAQESSVAHLDLDTIAWREPAVRADLCDSIQQLKAFAETHKRWVIEGCYGSLLAEAAKLADEVIFLNPGVEGCQANARARPWEPHKYESKEAQDKNLAMLLEWIAQYPERSDEFSLGAHREVFDAFLGKKTELKSNAEARAAEFNR